MTKVIIVGHAGYGTAMKRNINMLVGETPDFIFVNFNEQDDLELLTNEQIRQLAAESETPEALLFNLSRLIPGATQSQFTAHLDQALYAADVLGYATATKGK